MSTTQKSNSDVTVKTDKPSASQENKKSIENKKEIVEENKTNNSFIRRRVWPD